MPCILLVGAQLPGGEWSAPTEPAGEMYPKPSENPFTTYYTAQGDFAELLAKFFKKIFSLPTTEDAPEMPNMSKRKTL